jgi:uncharacterized membrane protein
MKMSALPAPTLYHRWLGWHAPAVRQGALVLLGGIIAGFVIAAVQPWQVAVVGGWDVAATVLLAVTLPMIARADSAATVTLARREDPGRFAVRAILLVAAVASLVGVATLLALAGRHSGSRQVVFIAVAIATVVLSWTVVNTVYVLRYTHLRFVAGCAGFNFPDAATRDLPRFRDFAYVAFTIGMTYQVSDTSVNDPRTRSAVLSHSLLAYLFGVVIIGGSINLVAGLLR